MEDKDINDQDLGFTAGSEMEPFVIPEECVTSYWV